VKAMMRPFGSFGSPNFPGGMSGSPNFPGGAFGSSVPGDFNRNGVPDIVEYQRWLEQRKKEYYWDQQRKNLTKPLVGSLSPIYKRSIASVGSSRGKPFTSPSQPILGRVLKVGQSPIPSYTKSRFKEVSKQTLGQRLSLPKCIFCNGQGTTLNGSTGFFCKGTGLTRKR
jgi:hypothetical protein